MFLFHQGLKRKVGWVMSPSKIKMSLCKKGKKFPCKGTDDPISPRQHQTLETECSEFRRKAWVLDPVRDRWTVRIQ